MSDALDRWICKTCRWEYEGSCRPHEPFGHTVEEVGAHMWREHQDVGPSSEAGEWSHVESERR